MILQRSHSQWLVFCLFTILGVEIAAQRKFRFAVTEPGSASYSHERAWQDDGTTQGSYRTLMPDGRWQVVNYHADDDGFKAHIRYEPSTTAPPLATVTTADNDNSRSPARWKFPEELQTPSAIPAPPTFRSQHRDTDAAARIQHESLQSYSSSTQPYLDDYVLPGPAFRQSDQSLVNRPNTAAIYPQHRAPFEPIFPFFNPEKQQTEFHKQPNYVLPRPNDIGPTPDSPRPAAYDGATALLYGLQSIAGQNSPEEPIYSTLKKRPKPRPQSENFYPYNDNFNSVNRPIQYTTPVPPVDLPFLQYPFDNTDVTERPVAPKLPVKQNAPFLSIPGIKGPFPSPQPPLPFRDEDEQIPHTILAAPVPERNAVQKPRPRPFAPKEDNADKPITFVPPPFPKKPAHRTKSSRPQSSSSNTEEDQVDRPIVFNPPPFPKKGSTKSRPKVRPLANDEEEPRKPLQRETSEFDRLPNHNSFSEPHEPYSGTPNLQYINGDSGDAHGIVFNPPAFRAKNVPSSATLDFKDSVNSKPSLKRPQHGGFGQRLRPLKRPSMQFSNDGEDFELHNSPVTQSKPFNKQKLFFQEAQLTTPNEPIDLFFPPNNFAPIVIIPPQTIIHPIANDQSPVFIPPHATPSSVHVPVFESPEESRRPTTEVPPPLPPAALRPRIRIHGHPSAEAIKQALPRARAVDAPVQRSPTTKSNAPTVSVPAQTSKTIARSATTKAPVRRVQHNRSEQSKPGISIVTSKPKVAKVTKPKLNDTTTAPPKAKGTQAQPSVKSVKEEFMAEAAQASAYTATSPSVKPDKSTSSFVTVWAVALPLTHSESTTEIVPNTTNAL